MYLHFNTKSIRCAKGSDDWQDPEFYLTWQIYTDNAFLSGFSERFFLRILDNISDRFNDASNGQQAGAAREGKTP